MERRHDVGLDGAYKRLVLVANHAHLKVQACHEHDDDERFAAQKRQHAFGEKVAHTGHDGGVRGGRAVHGVRMG
jgi:hypothetical protein